MADATGATGLGVVVGVAAGTSPGTGGGGMAPVGEKAVWWERLTAPPAGMETFQLIAAPLSMRSVHRQVFGSGTFAPIASHTWLNDASRN